MIAVPVGETKVIVIESRRDRGLDSNQLHGYDRDAVNNDGVLVYTVDSSLGELPIRFATDGGEGIMDQSPILPVGTYDEIRELQDAVFAVNWAINNHRGG